MLKKKLTQYYKKIKINQELFCNFDVILNLCNKLNMYNIEYSQFSINITYRLTIKSDQTQILKSNLTY